MIGRISHRLIAEVPFAGEIRRVAILLEELSDRRRLGPQIVFISRSHDDRECCTNRNAPGHERGASRRATRLSIPTGKHGTLLGHPVDVRSGMTEGCTSA